VLRDLPSARRDYHLPFLPRACNRRHA
jgi:hypothetical protein